MVSERFINEMDAAQDECYNDYLHAMGLTHTEQTWNIFVNVWNAGKDWGHQMELV